MALDRRSLLDEAAIAGALGDLPGWSRDGLHLRASWRFGDFVQAFGFMASVALVAEALNHHPEWSNVYGSVDIGVTNHDVGGLTELDVEFCRRVSAIAAPNA